MSERTYDRAPWVAVIGEGDPQGADVARILAWAEEVGERLAQAGAVVITGGLGGVMEAASRGAANAGGRTIGILPGEDRSAANPFVQLPIATGLGVVRNLVVVTAADIVIAVGGRYGTLSEIGLALRQGREVVTLGSWQIGGVEARAKIRVATNPIEAVETALKQLS